nr:hypothetical protein [Clostridium botulinum]
MNLLEILIIYNIKSLINNINLKQIFKIHKLSENMISLLEKLYTIALI